MKTILIALLLTLAPAIGAQEIVPLGEPDWWDDRLTPSKAAYEDGECAEFYIIQSNQLPNINWDLEKRDAAGNIIAPDSIVFIVEGLAEVYGFSGWSDGDYLILGHTSASGRISFPYSVIKGAPHFRVGIAAHPKRLDKTANVGGKCIDAAYAVYLPKDLGVDPIVTQSFRDSIATHPVKWHDELGRVLYTCTTIELENMRPNVWLQGPYPAQWTGRRLCFKRKCTIELDDIR